MSSSVKQVVSTKMDIRHDNMVSCLPSSIVEGDLGAGSTWVLSTVQTPTEFSLTSIEGYKNVLVGYSAGQSWSAPVRQTMWCSVTLSITIPSVGVMSNSIQAYWKTTPFIERVLDKKSGLYIHVLNTPKDERSIDLTEGILFRFVKSFRKGRINSVDLVRRARKRGSHNVRK